MAMSIFCFLHPEMSKIYTNNQWGKENNLIYKVEKQTAVAF